MSAGVCARVVPAGYLYKHVKARGDWVGNPDRPQRILSLSGCISPSFADYIGYWRHNGLWLFDRPEIIEALAAEHGISLDGATCFFFEQHEHQFDTQTDCWSLVVPEPTVVTDVAPPQNALLRGYDVVTFSMGNAPECSPLSCNGLAADVKVNGGCLLDTFEDAKAALESGLFRNAEPGPCRIVTVYEIACLRS